MFYSLPSYVHTGCPQIGYKKSCGPRGTHEASQVTTPLRGSIGKTTLISALFQAPGVKMMKQNQLSIKINVITQNLVDSLLLLDSPILGKLKR